jgi:hypothetical protein
VPDGGAAAAFLHCVVTMASFFDPIVLDPRTLV